MKIWNKSIKTLKKIIISSATPLVLLALLAKQSKAFAFYFSSSFAQKKTITFVSTQNLLAPPGFSKNKTQEKLGLKIIEQAKKLKDQCLSSPIFLLSKPFIRVRYTLQKQSAAYNSPIRVACKLFIVYIFGSFCWLAYNTSKYSGNLPCAQQKQDRFLFLRLAQQKMSSSVNLFQEIIGEITNLPLLKTAGELPASFACCEKQAMLGAKGKYTAETVENIILKEKENFAFTTSLINEANRNETSVHVKLSPFWHDFYTQNYVGRQNMDSAMLARVLQNKNAFPNHNLLALQSTCLPLAPCEVKEAVGGLPVLAQQSKLDLLTASSKQNTLKLVLAPEATPQYKSEIRAIPASIALQEAKGKHTAVLAPHSKQKQSFLPSACSAKQAKTKKHLWFDPHQERIIFFARKPLLLNQLQNHQFSKITTNQEDLFLNKNQIALKDGYTYSGTSLVSGPETDLLPRKLASLQTGFFCNKTTQILKQNASKLSSENGEITTVKTPTQNKPQLVPARQLVWVKDLSMLLPTSLDYLSNTGLTYYLLTVHSKQSKQQAQIPDSATCFASQAKQSTKDSYINLPFNTTKTASFLDSTKQELPFFCETSTKKHKVSKTNAKQNNLQLELDVFDELQKREDFSTTVTRTPTNPSLPLTVELSEEDTSGNTVIEKTELTDTPSSFDALNTYLTNHTPALASCRAKSKLRVVAKQEPTFRNLAKTQRNEGQIKYQKLNENGKNRLSYIDFFYESRLQSGFNYPDVPCKIDKNPAYFAPFAKLLQSHALAKQAKDVDTSYFFCCACFACEAKQAQQVIQNQKDSPINRISYILPTASTSIASFTKALPCKEQSIKLEGSVLDVPALLRTCLPLASIEAKEAGIASSKQGQQSNCLAYCACEAQQVQQAKEVSKNRGQQGEESLFLEFVYRPNHLQGYISYKTAEGLITFPKNSIISRLPIRTPTQFVALNKIADIKLANCLLEKLKRAEFNVIKEDFSQNKKDVRKVSDAPESFFGGGSLQLGERANCEKFQGNQQIGVLYGIHTGDPYAPVQKLSLPYTSTGTSLRTVFGKIHGNEGAPGINFTKSLKTKKLITNYRTVSNWAVATYSTGSWLDKVLPGDTAFGNLQELKDSKESEIGTSAGTTLHPSTSFFKRLFYFNRVAGKTDYSLESPFLYYNPNSKVEGMPEDTVFRVEEYKKAMLFPQVHAFHRGMAFNSLPAEWKQCKEYTDQDIDIQSILGGMRQRIESESTAEMHPKAEHSETGVLLDTTSEKVETGEVPKALQLTDVEPPFALLTSPSEQEVSQPVVQNNHQNVDNSAKTVEKEGRGKLAEFDAALQPQNQQKLQTNSSKTAFREKKTKDRPFRLLPSFLRSVACGRMHKQVAKNKHNKKLRSTNIYPLRTVFTVSPQKCRPQLSLGPTDIGEYNYIGLANTYSGVGCATGLTYSACEAQQVQLAKAKQVALQSGILSHNVYRKGLYLERVTGLPHYSWMSLSKFVFLAYGWYGYKILATALNKSTRLLPVGFTEAIGLQTVQEKYRIIRQSKTKHSFRDLAGAEKTLSELRDLIWTFRLGTGEYSRKKLHIPYLGSQDGQRRSSMTSKTRNRLLLVGPPGTGKTLLVKTLAAEANVPVIVQPASQLRMISGVENPVSALFHLAKQIKPCIIFLDELDTLGSASATVTTRSTSEQAKAIRLARKYTYTLLLELDGLTSSTNDLLIIGATNRPETLNPALTRAGRFDTIINYNLPSQEQRLAVLSLYINKHNMLPLEPASGSQNTAKARNLTLAKVTTCLAKQAKEGKNYSNNRSFHSIRHNTAPSFLSPNAVLLRLLGLRSKASKSKQAQLCYLPFASCEAIEAGKIKSRNELRLYLAQKCYGLSQASIATVVNESALESMLYRNRAVHTLDTLERAIESVRILTAKGTNYSPFRRTINLDVPPVKPLLAVRSKQGKNLQIKQSKTKQIQQLPSVIKHISQKSLVALQKKQTTRQFLVFTAYEAVGSLLLLQKHPGLKKNVTNTKTIALTLEVGSGALASRGAKEAQQVVVKPQTHCEANQPQLLAVHSKHKQSNCIAKQPSTNFNNSSTRAPIDRKNLEVANLKTYAGKAAVSIYSSTRPQIFTLSARSGLYTNPIDVGTLLANLNTLTGKLVLLDNSYASFCSASSKEFTSRDQRLPKFMSETSITKQKVSNFAGFASSLAFAPQVAQQATEGNNVNPAVILHNTGTKNSLQGGLNISQMLPNSNSAENPEVGASCCAVPASIALQEAKGKQATQKQKGEQQLSTFTSEGSSCFAKRSKSTVKLSNPLTTRWFRIYLYRPFFRYDSTESIENKEYYPINDYSMISRKTRQLSFRNVSTRRVVKQAIDSKEVSTKQKITSSFCLLASTSETQLYHGVEGKLYCQRDLVRMSEESLYLAIVASAFHKAASLVQEHRELLDYCVYKTLRYGVLYEFSLNILCNRF